MVAPLIWAATCSCACRAQRSGPPLPAHARTHAAKVDGAVEPGTAAYVDGALWARERDGGWLADPADQDAGVGVVGRAAHGPQRVGRGVCGGQGGQRSRPQRTRPACDNGGAGSGGGGSEVMVVAERWWRGGCNKAPRSSGVTFDSSHRCSAAGTYVYTYMRAARKRPDVVLAMTELPPLT